MSWASKQPFLELLLASGFQKKELRKFVSQGALSYQWVPSLSIWQNPLHIKQIIDESIQYLHYKQLLVWLPLQLINLYIQYDIPYEGVMIFKYCSMYTVIILRKDIYEPIFLDSN